VAQPPRGAEVLAAVGATGGAVIAVSEEEIAGARRELARAGVFVEPTGAVAWAGMARWLGRGRERGGERGSGQTTVVALGGAGLKSD
jgi:threonine synthase